MKAGLLILTAGFGEGHNAAARAIAAAWDAQHPCSRAHVLDVFAIASPRLNPVARRGYLRLINQYPRLWRVAYRWIDRSEIFPWLLLQFRAERRTLARAVATLAPRAICSTYPVYGFWLRQLARGMRELPPYFNVVTDSISINSLWCRGDCAGWIAPNEESAQILQRSGLALHRLAVLGFPVAPEFNQPPDTRLPNLAEPGTTPRVLHLVNSGTRGALETAERLLAHPSWAITCAVGRDEAMRERLAALAVRRTAPTRVLGWTNEIPHLLFTHHVVISKAGGATTQEALAAACPMIVSQVVPGQEEGNVELLRQHGIGAVALTPTSVMRQLEQAFADGGHLWHLWRGAARRLSRPSAAADIARFVSQATTPAPLQTIGAPS